MKKRRSYFFLAVLVILLIQTSGLGCGRRPELRPKVEKVQKTKIAVSFGSSLSENHQVFRKVFQERAQEAQLEVLWLDGENDGLKQADALEKAGEEGIKALLADPVDPGIIAESLRQVQKKGVKIIALNSLPPDTAVDAYLAPDYQRAGEVQGQQFLAGAGEGKTYNVLVVRGKEGRPVPDSIVRGNLQVLKGQERVGALWVEEASPDNASAAREIALKYLDPANLPLAIIAHSDQLTRGILKGREEWKGAGEVLTFGLGTALESMETLGKKGHTAEIDLMPELLAQLAVKATSKVIKDEAWEYDLVVPNGTQNAPARFTPVRSITGENKELLQERMKEMKKGTGNQEGEKGGENDPRGENQEENSGEGNPGSGSGKEGEEEKPKTQVKIKTKDGQEFEMNIRGEIESIELKKGGQEQEAR